MHSISFIQYHSSQGVQQGGEYCREEELQEEEEEANLVQNKVNITAVLAAAKIFREVSRGFRTVLTRDGFALKFCPPPLKRLCTEINAPSLFAPPPAVNNDTSLRLLNHWTSRIRETEIQVLSRQVGLQSILYFSVGLINFLQTFCQNAKISVPTHHTRIIFFCSFSLEVQFSCKNWGNTSRKGNPLMFTS